MTKLILKIGFIISMILFTIFLVKLGYSKREFELMYFALGLPIWFYMLVVFVNMANSLEIRDGYVLVRNVIPGRHPKLIKYKEIDSWEESRPIGTSTQALILKANGEKIVISNMIDLKNYELLRIKLRVQWGKREIKYI